MIQFCDECYQEFINSPSWLTPAAQWTSAIVAGIALYVAYKNLGGVRRSQALQGQMNLITLENEMRKNLILYKQSLDDYAKATIANADELSKKRVNAFELYVTSADKIAALINSDFLYEQFPDRDWDAEYKEIFKKVIAYHEGEDNIIPGKSEMIRNIKMTIGKWERQ
jgi:hypothetical protein